MYTKELDGPVKMGQWSAGAGHYTRMSFHEMAKSFDRPVIQTEHERCASIEGSSSGKSWFGGLTSTAEAIALMRDGWKEGTEKIRAIARKLASSIPQAKSLRRRQSWMEDGDSLDVDRVFDGSDKPYRATARREVSGPREVNLMALYGGCGGHSAEELFWQGSVSAVLSDLLEDAGYSVRVSGIYVGAGDTNGGAFAIETVLKDYDEPLRLDTVAAVLSHAGIFRSFSFRNILQQPVKVNSGLGKCSRGNDAETFMRKYNLMESSAFMTHTCFSEDEALTEIRRVLALLTVQVDDK